VLDRQWRFTYLNSHALREAGCPREALVGRSLWEKYPGLMGTEVEAHYRRALAEQEPAHFETRGIHTGRWLEVHVYPFPNGLLVYGRDITDKKQAQAALQESEERFRGLMDHGPAVAWMKDEDGRYVYVNRRYAEHFRTSLEERRGRTDFDIRPADVAQRLVNADRAVLREDRPLELTEDVTDPDGSLRHWQVVKFPVRDASGRRYVGGMAVDVTERRLTEERLRDYAHQLRALSRRLLDVQEQERRHLARELHDEIGQALTGLHLTLAGGARLPPDQLAGRLAEAQALVKDLMGQVRDLSLRLRPSMLDDLGLLPALLWYLPRFTAQTGVRVAFEHSGLGQRLPPEVETAAYRIVQEALTNVARHARVEEAQVRVRLDGAVLGVCVEDAGVGFDPARAAGDTGGLSGMRERAAALGATLRVESRPGAGTRVTAVAPVNGL
jgi:PAS domain S-box-containing protein